MLFSLTRQKSFVVGIIVGFFSFSILLGTICIFIYSPSMKAEHHLEQARFYKDRHDISDYNNLSNKFLFLSEKELLASLFINPYQGMVWGDLANVAQAEKKHVIANMALRFSHKFSNNKHADLTINIAYNDAINKLK